VQGALERAALGGLAQCARARAKAGRSGRGGPGQSGRGPKREAKAHDGNKFIFHFFFNSTSSQLQMNKIETFSQVDVKKQSCSKMHVKHF
jgi:hypothetical protein